MDTSHLSFSLHGLLAGCARLDGIIIVGPENLTLQYRIRDSVIGAFAGEIATRTIPWCELEGVECGSGFLSPWLELRARNLSVFDKLPCATDPTRLRLRIAWKDRRRLRALTSEIELQLSYRAADRLLPRSSGASA